MSKKFKKISLKVEYLDLEIEEIEEKMEICNSAFDKEFEMELAYTKFVQNKAKKPPKEGEVHRPNPSKLTQKIYRNLAKKMHPDVCREEGAEERFKKVTKMYDDDDLVGLIKICNDQKIEIREISDDEMEIIECYIVNKEDSISKKKNVIPWVWYHSKEDKEVLKEKVYGMINFDVKGFEEWKQTNYPIK